MSLHNLASHVQDAGRGEDTVLIHMTPKEVSGLQALAMSHGGSLTINPDTGLPEAGFLSGILPMVIGAGLMMIPGMQPLGAAALTGAGYGIATGDVKRGLMAGLGAYGGAGIGQGLTTAGTEAAALSAAGAPAFVPGGEAALAQNQAIAADWAAQAGPAAEGARTAAANAPWSAAAKGFSALGNEAGRSAFMAGMPAYSGMAAGTSLLGALTPEKQRLGGGTQKALIRPYTFERTQNQTAYLPPTGTNEQNYFNDRYTALPTYAAPGPEYAAKGGLMGFAVGGPVETMSAMNAVGENLGYPQSQFQTDIYSNPNVQRPEAMNMIAPSGDVAVDQYTGEQKFANGGEAHLGGYSDGGRLLRGPGDGVSDSIPASISGRQPARLADGEFVVPARIVSELGNGSTEAGARKLYAMMDRVQNARKKSVGKNKVAVNSRAYKHLPA